MRIRITTESTGPVEAEVTDENPVTAKAILDALPLRGRVNTWGEEIYFTIPVEGEVENPKVVVELGDLAFWPPGNALCIFFGRTPASKGDEIRPASEVNVFGRIIGNSKVFKRVRDGEEVIIEAA
ncbi:hypothetical protein KAI10_06980 [Candidatus Bathyarchaeota archaeon]|nr:hypothetical protein [Candidatus Bathyarchaeota archaeon]